MTSAEWNEDFLDLVDCLNAEGAEYLVVGAFALAAHGLPRATGDLDVFVRPVAENARRVHAALSKFGAPLSVAQVAAEDFARPGAVYQLGLVPRRIDILTELSGVSFDEAWASSVVREIHGLPLRFIGYDALLLNKRTTGREKDARDAADLELVNARRD